MSDRRIIISDELSDEFIAYENVVIQLTDYYPFGMGMPGRQSLSGYRYGFNGKEKDDENFEGAYDYGARISDARLGRWLSVDSHSSSYPFQSPYSANKNSPLAYLDDDGNDNIIYLIVLPGAAAELSKSHISASEIAAQATKNFANLGLKTEVRVWEGKPEDFVFFDMDITDAVAVMGNGSEEAMNFMEKELDPKAVESVYKVEGDVWQGMKNNNPERSENYTNYNLKREELSLGGELIALDVAESDRLSNNMFRNTKKASKIDAYALLLNHGAGHNAGLDHSNSGREWFNTTSQIMNEYLFDAVGLKGLQAILDPKNNQDYIDALKGKDGSQGRFGDNSPTQNNPNIKNFGEKQ